MKIKSLALSLALVATIFTGCAKPAATPTPAATTPDKKTDVVTTASIVNKNDAFLKALTADGGHYVIAILNDMNFDKELVVNGDFKTGKKDANGNIIKDAQGNEQTQRKIALYTQDDKHKVTGRFTLTAPKMTFNSNNGSIEHGTFKGDLYIAGKNFKLVNAKIDGNIYFLNEDAQKTFTIKDVAADLDNVATVVTGTKELKK